MNPDLPWLEEELAAQSDWVRRLARSLVHDESAAEDLVQDTWVAALRRPPSDRRALRTWLARVVRTLAWKQQRKSATAPTTGMTGDHPGGAPESELVERLELHRALAEELHALREPLRTTLLQRYFEGRNAAEIAQQSGIPAATVRWRLQQGLEELRTRLDARSGGNRETWMSALAFALPSKGAVLGGTGTTLGGSGVAIAEGVLMSTLVKVSLGAAILVAAVMLALPFVTKEDSPASTALAGTGRQDLSRPGAESPPALAVQPESGRAALEQDPQPQLDALGPIDAQHTRILARILDEDHHPIPGAWLGPSELHSFNPMLSAVRSTSKQPAEERTLADAAGQVVLERPAQSAGESFRLAAGAPGHVTAQLSTLAPAGGSAFLGEITLSAAGSVSGFVRDENGAPLPGIDVCALRAGSAQRARDSAAGVLVLEPWDMRGELAPQATSGTDGSFALDGIAPGVVRLWGRLEGNLWAHAGPLDLAAGAQLKGIEVVARRPPPTETARHTLRGIVLQPDGAPLAGASVTAAGRSGSRAESRTGADGKFELVTSTRGPFFLSCQFWSATRKYRDIQRRDVVPGEQELELRFAEPHWMHLEIYADGKPAENVRVFTTSAGRRSGDILNRDPGDGPNAGRLLLPDTDFGIRVESEGFVPAEAGPFLPASAPESLRIELHATAMVSGHVLAASKAIQGAEVQLLRVIEAGEGYVGGFPTLYESLFPMTVRTDESGAFLLHVSESGKYHVCVRADGFALGDEGPFSIDPSRGMQDLVVALEPGGALEGTVLVAKGRSPAGIIVSMNRGDGAPRSQRVGPDGRFHFELLTPGPWVLARSDREVTAGMDSTFGQSPDSRVTMPFNCTIESGTTVHQDLDLRDVQACVLSGRLSLNGSPAWAWSIERPTRTGRNIYQGPMGSADLDSAGAFSLGVESPGEWTLEIRSPVESEVSADLHARLQLAAGKNTWAFDVPAGRVEGKLLSPHGSWIEVRARPEGLVDAILRAPIAADSTFSMPVVPAGPCEVVESRSDSTEPRVLTRFTVVAGQTTHVEIP